MPNITQSRIENLRNAMAEALFDAQLVLIDENRRYLSGYTAEDTGYDESAGALLITAKDLILLTDSRYTLQAQNECPDFEIITYRKGLSKELPDILVRLKAGCPARISYEKRKMSCEQFEMINDEIKRAELPTELIDSKEMVEKFRIIKTQPEIDAIKESLALAENAFINVLSHLAPGMKETEVAWAMEKQMREGGAQSLSFPVIVAVGANAALPHATPGPSLIEPGKPLLFDWGAKLNGYCSDISRTVIIGKPDSEYEKVFNAVYDAQQKATEAVRPGAYTMEIDAIARDVLREKGLDGFFGHGLGHGVGLAIHEKPSLSPVSERNTRLEENMVFTIEPGVYIPVWGGVRLENMVVVRHDGPEVLNNINVRCSPAI